MADSRKLPLPGWPFLVANHEIGRVDYRPVVAPAFLCEQDCSPILTMLPLSDEPEKPHATRIHYTAVSGKTCQVVAIYRERVLKDTSVFAFPPQRQVRYISGIVLFSGTVPKAIPAELLESAESLTREDYVAFCRSENPISEPVGASWPMGVSVGSGLVLQQMPDFNGKELRFGTLASRPTAPPSTEEVVVISEQQIEQRLTGLTWFQQFLQMLFRKRA